MSILKINRLRAISNNALLIAIQNQAMSFQNTTHVVQEFVPTYTVKSEYLPTNRVLDGKQAETTEWV